MNSAAKAAYVAAAEAAASVAAEAVTANPKPDDVADSSIIDELRISSLHFPCVGPKSFYIEKAKPSRREEEEEEAMEEKETDKEAVKRSVILRACYYVFI